MNKARHAYGNSENLQSAIDSGAVDAYDVLFLDGDTKPKIGWVDSQGIVRIVDTDTSALEEQIATKVDADAVQTMVDSAVETAIAEGVAVEVVEF